MKDVRLARDFTYKPKRNVHISYKGGATYCRVPEAAVRAIVAAGAGCIVSTANYAMVGHKGPEILRPVAGVK